MKRCTHCRTLILFGGIRDGENRYCKQACYEAHVRTQAMEATHQAFDADPELYEGEQQTIEDALDQLHQGDCPICKREGPIDIHFSFFVYSFGVATVYKATPNLCCRRCARSRQLGGLFGSALFGWWGFPFGLLITPVYLGKN